MSEPTLSQQVMVTNEVGLHLRPAGMFVKCAGQFDSKIEVIKSDERAGGESVLDLVALGAGQGTELLIEATGHDAQAALAALTELFERGFAEDESSDRQEAENP